MTNIPKIVEVWESFTEEQKQCTYMVTGCILEKLPVPDVRKTIDSFTSEQRTVFERLVQAAVEENK